MHPEKPLLYRLVELIQEFNTSAEQMKANGEDEAYCATSAAAERLKEVCSVYIPNRPGMTEAEIRTAFANGDVDAVKTI